MNNAWEVTEEDVSFVLTQHGSSQNSAVIFDEYFCGNQDNIDRVIEAVLYYTEFDDQVETALSVIEDILLENNVIVGEKQHHCS